MTLTTDMKAKSDHVKIMKKEVEEVRANLERQVVELEGIRRLYQASQEEVKDCEAVFVTRTRAQLMWQYLNGESSVLDAHKEVDAYLPMVVKWII